MWGVGGLGVAVWMVCVSHSLSESQSVVTHTANTIYMLGLCSCEVAQVFTLSTYCNLTMLQSLNDKNVIFSHFYFSVLKIG